MSLHQSTPATSPRHLLASAAMALLLIAPSAFAQSPSEAARASLNASVGIPVAIVAGTAQMFRDGGQLSVTGIRTSGKVATIALRGLASGAEASVQVSASAIEGSAVAVGSVLQASVSAAGVLLVSAGRALMFIPNEAGMALLHHSRARDD